MKGKLLIITLMIFSKIAFCLTVEQVIENANQLINEKKYESAYQILDNEDPFNSNPEIVIEKTNLLLDYFVTSMMHNLFALTDLKPNEDIMDIRGSSGTFTMHLFYADSLLVEMIKDYPNNYKLRKTLGKFYHEIHLKYSNAWLEPDSTVVNKFLNNYLISYEHSIYDETSTFGIGYAMVYNQRYSESIPYFIESIKLNDKDPTSHYNLAYAYLYDDQRKKAIEHAKIALELYNDPIYKADAARMIAVIYEELNELDNSISYYRKSEEISPNHYYSLKPLLSLELTMNDTNYIITTNQLFELDPENPTIYQNIISSYSKESKFDELLLFFESKKDEFKKDNLVTANLYLYTGLINFEQKDFNNSKNNFKKAIKYFNKIYKSNHEVFNVIDSYLKEM